MQFLSENRLNGRHSFGRFGLNFAFPHIPRHNVSGVVPMHSGQIAPEQTRSSH